MAIKTSRSKDNPLSDRIHHQLNDEQILAVSNSQVSVRANQKQFKPSEQRWIEHYLKSYKTLKSNQKVIIRPENTSDEAEQLKKEQTVTSPFLQITTSCKEVLKYYVQREMIKRTISKDFLVKHKFKRSHVRAPGSIDKTDRRHKSVTQSIQEDWDFRLPNQISPREDSLHDSVTSFGSATFCPYQFSNRKKTTLSEFPDTIFEGD